MILKIYGVYSILLVLYWLFMKCVFIITKYDDEKTILCWTKSWLLVAVLTIIWVLFTAGIGIYVLITWRI